MTTAPVPVEDSHHCAATFDQPLPLGSTPTRRVLPDTPGSSACDASTMGLPEEDGEHVVDWQLHHGPDHLDTPSLPNHGEEGMELYQAPLSALPNTEAVAFDFDMASIWPEVTMPQEDNALLEELVS